jgi:hypothetical protein
VTRGVHDRILGALEDPPPVLEDPTLIRTDAPEVEEI